MRFRWMLGLVCALLLTAIFAIPAPASGTHRGTVTSVSLTVSENNLAIPFNNYTGYTFFLGATDQIAYSIQVLTGSNIDLYFFSTTGLASYRSDPPQTSQALVSHVNSQQFAGTFTGSSGSITVIIDNVNGTGATPTGEVTVQFVMSKNGSGPPSGDIFTIGLAICIGVIAVIVFVIVLIVYLITKANRPAMPPPMPPYMPPQQPWQPPPQPPQGGNPPGQWPPGNP